MAEKSFGVKEINLIGASGTPTIESPNNLNLNAVNVAISTNVSIGGTLSVTGNVSVGGTLTYEDVTNIDVVGIATFRDDVKINEDKELTFDGADGGKIVADGSNFIIEGTNSTGGTYIRGGNELILSGGQVGSHQTTVRIDKSGGNGFVELLYGGNKKLETTSTGIDVTGGITVGGSALSIDPSTSDIQGMWTISGGTSGYTFTGPGQDGSEQNPDIFLVRGQRYRFVNNIGGGHPFEFRNFDNNADYTDGITGTQSGTQDFNVQHDAPSKLKYRCTIHTSTMLGNIYIIGSSSPGVTYELISQGASISAGTYVDISGYKAVYFQGYNDPATNGNNRNGPYISTSNSTNSGVSTQNGRWWRLTYSAYSTSTFNPSTSNLYYGSNFTDDDDKVWMLEILGLDQTNVFLRTTSHNSSQSYPTAGWTANTSSAISTPYLYFHQALLQYIVYGVK
tara:strand:+ start:4747 stop:6099 length:1353 start_codon:yes stop_codon:yes gene_type:complete